MRSQTLPLRMRKNCSTSETLTVFLPPRRPARVVEEARLESVYTGNRIKGSNPLVSANLNSFAAQE